jgi:iron complex transport system permease protein
MSDSHSPSAPLAAHPLSHGPLLIGALLLLALASLAVALAAGSVRVPWSALWAVLTGGDTGLNRTLLLELRLPRALGAFATGALLALAGALMQVLLRNPLADPYILGVSGGAALAALGTMLLGLGGLWLSGGAFVGAVLSMLLVFGLAHGRGHWTPTRLLLTGVVVAAGWGALISFLLAVSPEANLRGMLFWLMGDLSHVETPWPALGALAAGLLFALPLARSLNVLALGELRAGALGVAVPPLRIGLYALASLLTAAAVTVAGTVAFVGLIVPHMLRLVGAQDHRLLLPGSALLGGTLLVLADTVARTAFAPRQLPVGVVTALFGVPAFLYLLSRAAGRAEPGRVRGVATPAEAARTIGPGIARGRPARGDGRDNEIARPLLEACALEVAVAGRTLCRGLDLRVLPGERWAILGPNGAGKTSLLHTLAGLRPPAGGELRFSGRPLAAWPRRALARHLGLLPQDSEDPFPASVLETTLVGRHPHLGRWRWEGAEDLAAARAALAAVGLEGMEGRLSATLSGGERRRLAIATLLAQAPVLYLLDEPANHLDLHHQAAVLRHFADTARHGARALLMVLHDPNLASRYCDHVLLLFADGEALAGPAQEVLSAERLTRLYGHPLVPAALPDGARGWLPV